MTAKQSIIVISINNQWQICVMVSVSAMAASVMAASYHQYNDMCNGIKILMCIMCVSKHDNEMAI